MNDEQTIQLTEELIKSAGTESFGGMGKQYAWNRAQICALGIAYPPRKGWLRALVGRRIPLAQWQKFVSLSKKNRNVTRELF